MGALGYVLFGILSAVATAAGIVVGYLMHRSEFKNAGDEFDKKHYILTPFYSFLLCFLIGMVALFVPVCYTALPRYEGIVVKILKTLCLSVYSAVRVFVFDGEFDSIQSAVAQSGLSACGKSLYTLYGSLMFMFAPVFTSIFVLSFFKNLTSYLKYAFSRSKTLCYISELNERSAELASSIISKEGKKVLICFFDVFERNEEANFELVDRVKKMRCICLKRDITQIGLKRGKDRKRKFYFIGKDEDENVKQALTLIERCREMYNTEDTQFYIFSTAADSEVLFDSVDTGKMKVRRVNGIRNLALNTLLNEPIFEHYIPVEDRKKVSVLIVGAGTYGTELVKALTWCGQIPGYDISIHVLDQKQGLETKFEVLAPELMSKNKDKEDGEPHYEITFHSGVDVTQTDFAKFLGQTENITTAFVTLGNDALNVDVAMKLRRDCERLKMKQGYFIPHIYSVVYSTVKNKTLYKNDELKKAGGIKFIGSIGERYSLANIEQRELEAVGEKLHFFWCNYQKNSRVSYERYEYNRRASMAAAIHAVMLNVLNIPFSGDDDRKKTEHERWSAYMRAEGQVYASQKSAVAKTHHDLRPYGELDAATQQNDSSVQRIEGTEEMEALLALVRERRKNA